MFKFKLLGSGILAVLLGAGLTRVSYRMITGAPFNAKDYGAKCDSATDDTAALQLAINAAGAVQGEVILPGACRITAPLVLPFGVTLTGYGPTFGSGLVADGTGFFNIDGANYAGGFAFRLNVRHMLLRHLPGSAAPATGALVKVKTAYNVEFRDVFMTDVPTNTSGFDYDAVNDINMVNVVIRGETGGSNNYGVKVHTTSTVKISNADIEALFIGVEVLDSAVVDVISPYMERVIVGVDNNAGTTGRVTIIGGYITVANDSCWPVRNLGTNTVISGTQLVNQSGVQIYSASASTDSMYYDRNNRRLQLGLANAGNVLPPNLLTLNPGGTQGASAGWSLGSAASALGGEYQSHIGGASTFVNDWNFAWSGSGTKTARFFGNGAATLNVFTDGEVIATAGIEPGPTTFAGLGANANGVMRYCSDCTIANPCAGGGTGAFAKRLNGIWVCN